MVSILDCLQGTQPNKMDIGQDWLIRPEFVDGKRIKKHYCLFLFYCQFLVGTLIFSCSSICIWGSWRQSFWLWTVWSLKFWLLSSPSFCFPPLNSLTFLLSNLKTHYFGGNSSVGGWARTVVALISWVTHLIF